MKDFFTCSICSFCSLLCNLLNFSEFKYLEVYYQGNAMAFQLGIVSSEGKKGGRNKIT